MNYYWVIIITSITEIHIINESKGYKLHNYIMTDISFKQSNDELYIYLKDCFENNRKFFVGRLSCLEPIVVHQVIINKLSQSYFYKLSNNAGILCTSKKSLNEWAEAYYESMKNSTNLGIWEKEGGVYKWTGPSQEFFLQILKPRNTFLAPILGSFSYMSINEDWTRSLIGKKILVISPFVDSFKKQVEKGILGKLFKNNENWFRDSTFQFIKTPQTQAGNHDNIDWSFHFNNLCETIDKYDNYDVALLSCGGYGMPLSNYIYKKGNSAIYVGGVLQIYFGVMGHRWEEDQDITSIINSEFWIHPSDDEKPSNFRNVEGGCYW